MLYTTYVLGEGGGCFVEKIGLSPSEYGTYVARDMRNWKKPHPKCVRVSLLQKYTKYTFCSNTPEDNIFLSNLKIPVQRIGGKWDSEKELWKGRDNILVLI